MGQPSTGRETPEQKARIATAKTWKPGTLVLVTDDYGEQWLTTTRSEVFMMGDQAMVQIEGIAGGYLASRLVVADDDWRPYFGRRKKADGSRRTVPEAMREDFVAYVSKERAARMEAHEESELYREVVCAVRQCKEPLPRSIMEALAACDADDDSEET